MSQQASKPIQDELQAYIEEAVSSGRYANADEVLSKALELLRTIDKSTVGAQKRHGGQWRGQVAIAADFDNLPDDLADSFGVK